MNRFAWFDWVMFLGYDRSNVDLIRSYVSLFATDRMLFEICVYDEIV